MKQNGTPSPSGFIAAAMIQTAGDTLEMLHDAIVRSANQETDPDFGIILAIQAAALTSARAVLAFYERPGREIRLREGGD